MAGKGPAPKDPSKRRRRNKTATRMLLPAEGRQGPTPRWPLAPSEADLHTAQDARRRFRSMTVAELRDECRDAGLKVSGTKDELIGRLVDDLVQVGSPLELELWDELWSTPQAAAWEHLGYTREVALYVRHQIAAEQGSLDHAKEARMRSDRLGLTPDSLRRLQWEISSDEVGRRREERETPSRRPKLRAVDPAAANE